jgi:hypothetical protein
MSTITLERLTKIYPGGRGVRDLIFGLYGLNVVGSLNESLAALRVLSPLRYAEAAQVIKAGGLSGGALVLSAVTLAAVGAACLWFERKDLRA